jgi:hypothetical protein
MKYLCIEDGKVISMLDYVPNVPKSVEVLEISDLEAEELNQGKRYYDSIDKKTKAVKKEILDSMDSSNKSQAYLNSTDWMILRHMRQLTLGIATSLSDSEYLKLEKSRQAAAMKIIKT